MRRINSFIIVNCLLISQCFCDSNVEEPDKLLSCFVNYLNNVPNISYKYEDAFLQLQETEPKTKIEVKLKAIDLQNQGNVKIQKCHATLSGEGDCPEIVSHNCQDETGVPVSDQNEAVTEQVVSATIFEQGPVNGESNVNSDTAEVSEEQSIVRPHVKPVVPCVGCSSHVNPQASGVDQLANLGIRHLDKHEPDVKHSLNTVLDVERQVQVVNGVRYILTLDVKSNTCSSEEIPACVSSKTCKITVLEKPWKKLVDGSKYKAILSNNCTEEWFFGDDGEVILDNAHANNEDNEVIPTTDNSNVIPGEEVITVRNANLQSRPLHEKNLSDDEIQRLEEQIIPTNQLNQPYVINERTVEDNHEPKFSSSNTKTVHYNNQERTFNNPKKAIDELINWFDNHYTVKTKDTEKIKRSTGYDVSSQDLLTSTNLVFVGAPVLQDVKDAKFMDLANESLLKYLKTSGNQQNHAVVKIENVTTQLVSGIKTVINFKILPTNCHVNANGQTTNCEVISGSDLKSCQSVIWEKPWEIFKQIDVNCGHISGTSRAKRMILGGEQEQDQYNAKYQILVDKSLKKYYKDTRTKQYHKLIEIQKVTTQVVAGILTRINFTAIATKCKVDNKGLPTSSPCTSVGGILNCYSKIWSQPWKNFEEINVTCGMDQKCKNKREIGIPGGRTEQSPGDPKYIALAEESLQKFVQISGTTQHHTVVEIEKVTSQVVAGSMTRMNFVIAPTNCKVDANGQATSSNCEIVNGADKLNCYSEIFEQPWNKLKKIDVNCSKNQKLRAKREGGALGGKTEQSPSDPKYIALAEESLQKFVQISGTTQHHTVVEIQKVTSQVVAGSMTRMNFVIAPTNCKVDVNGQATSSKCEIVNGADKLDCYSEIFEQPWNKLKQIDVNCSKNQKLRAKREVGVLGGKTEQSPSDPKYNALAEESLQKFVQISGTTQHHTVVEIQKVTSQVVAGSMTRMNFVIAPTNCKVDANGQATSSNCEIVNGADKLDCYSEIFEQPWNKLKQIDVNCATDTQSRAKRDVHGGSTEQNPNLSSDQLLLHYLMQETLQKLESLSLKLHRQKVLKINDYSTKQTIGKLTTINFDVGYTKCSKFESIDSLNGCELLTDMPIRHCVSTIWERSWIENGKVIDVICEDDDSITVEASDTTNSVAAKQLANESLKHIEAKYPHTKKQKVVTIFSLEKQMIGGVHYRMKIEVGYTNCSALSIKEDCELVTDVGPNKFCRVNVWLRPLNDHPPKFRVSCDYPQNATSDIYHLLQAKQLFNDFLSIYKPHYKDDLEQLEHRFQIFKENVKTIHNLNIHEKGTAKYGISRFADLSLEEFRNKYMGLKTSNSDRNLIPMRKADTPTVDLPQSFDWRDRGAVTEVKNQGSCGSCWAFSVTGNIEGQWKIKTGNLVSLSEQELVDCDKMDDGCNGGMPDTAYRAIEQMGGLMSEKDYPYEGDDEKCVFNKTLARVQISGAVNISSNETDMAKWLVARGPISIGINANAMQFYMGGVSHPWKLLCSPDNLDHGVLIVGYGEKSYPLFNKRLPYWVIKNSWGTMWGEQGYYRVYRGDGTCGVNMMASSAIV